jgi:hypothetical protein
MRVANCPERGRARRETRVPAVFRNGPITRKNLGPQSRIQALVARLPKPIRRHYDRPWKTLRRGSRAQATGIDASDETFDDRINQRRMGNRSHVSGRYVMTACVRQHRGEG